MTRTAAAAGAALPSDRRTFISNSLALASAVAASAVAPAGAGEHPDAALLALGREWEAAVLHQIARGEEADAACDRYDEPQRPDAVYRRSDDDRLFPYLYGDEVLGSDRRIFASTDCLDRIKNRGYGWPGNQRTQYGKKVRARADEIFAAHDA